MLASGDFQFVLQVHISDSSFVSASANLQVRPEVPSAVRACARAGVAVRMVTGDAAGTAIAVARRCGILPMDGPFEDDAVMIGSDFRTRCVPASSGGGGGAASASSAEEEMERVWPRLRVLARSTPLDKYALVAGIQVRTTSGKQSYPSGLFPTPYHDETRLL